MEQVAKILDEKAYFQIIASYKYKLGQKVGNPRYVECITLVNADEEFFKPVLDAFGGKVYKTGRVFKLSYSAAKASAILFKIKPYLSKQKDKALVLIELANHKQTCRDKSTENLLYRKYLKEKLEKITQDRTSSLPHLHLSNVSIL